MDKGLEVEGVRIVIGGDVDDVIIDGEEYQQMLSDIKAMKGMDGDQRKAYSMVIMARMMGEQSLPSAGKTHDGLVYHPRLLMIYKLSNREWFVLRM